MIGLERPIPLPMPSTLRPWRLTDTMPTRSAALTTIGLITILLAIVALAALFAGDISERTGGIISSVLGSFATVLAGLLLFLRVETVNTKVDDAASKAAVAAEKAASVERKVDQVHEDVLNGPMRANVKRAIKEAEADPEVRKQRIENVAKGVQEDRHATGSREQAAYARGVRDAQRRLEKEPGEAP